MRLSWETPQMKVLRAGSSWLPGSCMAITWWINTMTGELGS